MGGIITANYNMNSHKLHGICTSSIESKLLSKFHIVQKGTTPLLTKISWLHAVLYYNHTFELVNSPCQRQPS